VSDWIIKVEHLEKRYRIRHDPEGRDYVLLRDVLAERWKNLFRPRTRAAAETFFALRDVSFEINRGEVVAIIGRNGAGKSTLLKLLSRITAPSAGRIRIRGQISSLLEVGTGFHPELTGRENIYLNGTILGMTKKEIDRKLDAIIDFAGIEKFIDTPVKRFSSGMQVRLAFSVAAHLEPEILVIDEVLAVGDAAFQKKCLGKMQDVATAGRTVLFVSHDLAAVEKLCSRSILLEEGSCVADGPTSQIITQYLSGLLDVATSDLASRTDRKGEGHVRFTKIEILDKYGNKQSTFLSGRPLRIRLHYHANSSRPLMNCRVSVAVNGWGKVYFLASTELHTDECLVLPSEGFIDCVVDELPLSVGIYYLCPFFEMNGIVQDTLDSAGILQVEDGNFFGTGKDYPVGWAGKTVLVKHRWEIGSKSASAES